MSRLFLFLSLFSVLVSAAAKAADSKTGTTQMIVVFDDSGSMQGQRLADAKKAFADLLNSLRVMKDVAPVETVTVLPLNALESSPSAFPYTAAQNAIEDLRADGGTPLAKTILKAFAKQTSADNVIYFIFTDGEDDSGMSGVVYNALSNGLNESSSQSRKVTFVEVGKNNFLGQESKVAIRKELSSFRSIKFESYASAAGLNVAAQSLAANILDAGVRKQLAELSRLLAEMQRLDSIADSDLRSIESGIQEVENLKASIKADIESKKKEIAKLQGDAPSAVESIKGIITIEDRSMKTLSRISDVIQIANSLERRYQSLLESTRAFNKTFQDLSLLLEDLRVNKPEQYQQLASAIVDQIIAIKTKREELNAKIDPAARLISKIVQIKNDFPNFQQYVFDQKKELNSEILSVRRQVISQVGQARWDEIMRGLADAQIYLDSKTMELVYKGTHYMTEGGGSGGGSNLSVRNDGTMIILSQPVNPGFATGGSHAGHFTNNGTIIRLVQKVATPNGFAMKLYTEKGDVFTIDATKTDKTGGYIYGHFENGWLIFSTLDGNAYWVSSDDVFTINVQLMAWFSGSPKGFLIDQAKYALKSFSGDVTLVGTAVDLYNWFSNGGTSIKDIERKRARQYTQVYNDRVMHPSFRWLESHRPAQYISVPEFLIPVIKEIGHPPKEKSGKVCPAGQC